MAIDHYGSVNGPFYPFGLITVAAPGTPVALSVNFTAQQLTYLSTGTSEYALRFNQFYIQTPANTGNIYLCAPGGNKNITNSICFVIPPSQNLIIKTSATNRNAFGVNDLVVDSDTAANTCYVTAIVA
jgi:hypothetical protein